MEIRPLNLDDAEAYWHVRLEALETCPRAFGASPESHRARGVEGTARMIAFVEDERFVLGAWNGDTLVGTAGLLRNEDAATRTEGFVWGVYVAPAARGQGVGEALMRELIRRARDGGGYERIVLEVDADGPAVRLYEKVGFRPSGEAHPGKETPEGPVRLQPMSLDLR